MEITSTKLEPGSCNKKSTTQEKYPVQAVMFVPHTPGSELAKLLRANEEKISQITKNKIKIVERVGKKLQDLITKSNPWKGADCERKNCLLCFSKTLEEKPNCQDCHKRSLIYEITCLTCQEAAIAEI